jgi:phospholipase C
MCLLIFQNCLLKILQTPTKQADSSFLPKQEKGIRSSNALPYELYCDCHIESDKRSVSITMLADNTLFGTKAAGSPFQVFAPGKYKGELVRVWDYAVTAPGDMLRDVWQIADFEKEQYHLRVYGPNGFYREFIGNNQDPELTVQCGYDAIIYHRKCGNSFNLTKVKHH